MFVGFACSGDSGTSTSSASDSETSTTEMATTAGPGGSTSTGGGESSTSSGSSDPSGSESATAGMTSTSGTTDPTSDTETSGGVGSCTEKLCDGKLYACGDCLDNDGDGKIDLADPECISPCDDDESVFTTGIPGDNMDPCNQDCFFDGNSGAGDDKCNWNLKCDPESPGGDDCPYDPDFNNCPDMQNEACAANCAVPNGCDCFGCCTVSVGDMSYDIYLGDPDCSLDMIDQCESCTKNLDCDDSCEPEMCELCFGQDPDDLPPECDGNECEEGQPSCTVDDMGNDDCPDGFFCFVGCCEVEIG